MTLCQINDLTDLNYAVSAHLYSAIFNKPNDYLKSLATDINLSSFHLKYLDNNYIYLHSVINRIKELSENDIKNNYNREIKEYKEKQNYYKMYLNMLKIEGEYLPYLIEKMRGIQSIDI